MKVEDEVLVNCSHCGKMDKKHINRIHGVFDHGKIIIALVISAVVIVVLWGFYGAISTITGIIPVLIWIYEPKAASDFNLYKIRRR